MQRPIGFTIPDDLELDREMQKIFAGYQGRDVGVQASICGKIDNVDLPLSPYDRIVSIAHGKIVGHVDLTDLIARYNTSLGMPRDYRDRD